ncbi:MAG: short-chain dehydrogenase [Myxococcaceae bacterium]|nr:short-chain dehydrogenase [Myxococcaceae bacterium]
MSKSPLDGGVVVITGASSGIGREMARKLVHRARAIVLVARRRERLDELKADLLKERADLIVHIEQRDLGNVAGLPAMVESIVKAVGDIDVLVNNAGLGDMGVFDMADPVKTEGMITVNVTTLTLLTRAVLPGMIARKRGGILNISSSFGLEFLPGFASYIGTKHYVTGFTEGLRADCAGTGVVISQVCPGPVATEFEEVAGNFTGMKVPSLIEISAEHCARAAINGFTKGRALIIPGFVMRLVMYSTGMTPRFIRRWFAALLGARVRKMQLAAPPR